MNRVIVTGGSGFIGTNLIELLIQNNFEVINLDVNKPKNPNQLYLWIKQNVSNFYELKNVFNNFKPNYVIHLASRTDLRGDNITSYHDNIVGTQNIVDISTNIHSINRVVFASSMLINELGTTSKNDHDYSATTFYGISKAAAEKIVRDSNKFNKSWVIVRPTSIWGPWFGEPYIHFFERVLNERYIRFIPRDRLKTFGYVGNTVEQILNLMTLDDSLVNGKTFYLGDTPPLNIDLWSEKIAKEGGVGLPKRLPLFPFYFFALIGDFVTRLKISFPMTSFRLKNMITNNIIDLNPINKIVPVSKFSIDDGIKETIKWMRRNA